MYELKNGKVFTSKFVGTGLMKKEFTGPRSHKHWCRVFVLTLGRRKKKLLRHYGRREPRKFGNRCSTLYRLDEKLCGSQSLLRRSSDKKTPTHASASWNLQSVGYFSCI